MRRLASFVLGALTGVVALALLATWRGNAGDDARLLPSTRSKERFQSKRSTTHESQAFPPEEAAPLVRAHMLVDRGDALDERALESLCDASINVYEAMRNGDSRWQATVLRLSDLGYLRNERLQCAASYALPLRSECHGTLDMVLEPTTEGVARVVYARATTSAHDPGDAAPCAAYVDCLAETRVGSTVPIPRGADDLVAIRQDTIYDWTSPAMFDATKVAELVALREESLADAVAQGALDEFERLSEEQVISYLHQHLAELRESEATPSM